MKDFDLEETKHNELAYRKIQGIVGDQSLSVILPKSYMSNLGIREGDFVKVHQEEGKIVIEKA
jgi:formylmethanofuran dehydrogenase subunit D